MADKLPTISSETDRREDQIDLVAFIAMLWDGKWTIIWWTLLPCLIAAAILLSTRMPFEARTVIKPISVIDSFQYEESNALGFFEVTVEDLELLFVEKLGEGEIFARAITRFAVINNEDFDSEVEFDAATRRFVEFIEILPPVNEDGRERGVSRANWELRVVYNDRKKWLQVLNYVQSEAHEEIRRVLLKKFETAILVRSQEQNFKLQDLKTKVENVLADYDLAMTQFETRLAFDLEDVTTKIENALADYERTTSDRLAFLTEQAAIARKLGVAKNTIEAQTFSAQGGVLASVDTDTPFYLRGYEAIEKEIELMEAREDKRAFVDGLIELEKTQRKIEQDQTLARKEFEKQFLDRRLELEGQIRSLEQDRTSERARSLFQATPIWSDEVFRAARIVPDGTEFIATTSKLTILVLVGLLSALLSSVYVLVSNSMRNNGVSNLQADA